MNNEKVKGRWEQLAGKLREKWHKRPDDDGSADEAHSEYFACMIREIYGRAKQQAQKQVQDPESSR